MTYIGNPSVQSFATVTSQSFNGDGSTTVFTLNKHVNSATELECFVSNVQQEPGTGKAFTASGTTLTFSEAPPSGTGNIYVIYRGLAQHVGQDENAPRLIGDNTLTGNQTITGDQTINGKSTLDGLVFDGSSRKIIGFESGAFTITTGTSASSYNTYTATGLPTQYVTSHTVTFTNAFSTNNPKIFVYQRDGNNSGHSTVYRMWADNLSTTGFTLIVSDVSGSSSVVVNYIAIESTAS